MHASLTQKKQLKLYLKCGVTTIRDVGANLKSIRELHSQIEKDHVKGVFEYPRLLYCGPLLDGPTESYDKPELKDLIVSLKNKAEISKEIDFLLQNNVDAIKLYYGLDESFTKEIVDYVNNRCPVVMHCGKTKAIDAAKCGVKSIEHVMLSIHHDLIGTQKFNSYEDIKDKSYWVKVLRDWESFDLSDLSIKEYIKSLASTGVYLCSTLNLLWLSYIGLDYARKDPLRPLIDTSFVDPNIKDSDIMPPLYNPVGFKKSLDKQIEFLRLFFLEGGKVVGGTDFGANYYPPAGYCMHREVYLLSLALGNMNAIKAVTSVAATATNKSNELGAILPGYIADLVVLNKNPLDDILNLDDIHSVYVQANKIKF